VTDEETTVDVADTGTDADDPGTGSAATDTRTASEADTARVPDAETAGEAGTDHDAAAESFLELDEALDVDSSGHNARTGLVVDADGRDAAAVPPGYPLAGDPGEVVALTVDTRESATTVYLGWPDGDADVPLVRLLDAMDVELGDLYGREVRLERVEGHDVLVTPDERPRGNGRWQFGVVVGLAFVAGFLALLATGRVPWFGTLAWGLVTLVGLPYAVYRDAWYVRTHSDWSGGPLFWATLAMLPFLNLGTGVAYLWSRSRATLFGERRSLLDRVASRVREWL